MREVRERAAVAAAALIQIGSDDPEVRLKALESLRQQRAGATCLRRCSA